MKWFKHDSNASMDAKLQRLRMKYGMEGYGLYWFCLEAIARNVETHNLTFQLEEDAELIAAATGMHYEKVQDMMIYMVNIKLFENTGGILTCLKMATRTDEYTAKIIRDSNSLRTLSGHSPDTIGRKSDLIEENRIEEIVGKNRQRFSPPTTDQVRDYCKSRGNSVDPAKFVNFYQAKGWMVGKTKMKDWQAAVRTWEGGQSESKPAEHRGLEI
jgi:hypothetical protein